MTVITTKVLFEPRDLWIGLYIGGIEGDSWTEWRDYFVCIIPMFPIRIRHFWDKED